MSTHETACVYCGKACYCHDDEHALGIGGGCYDDDPMNFCSLECAEWLITRIAARIIVYKELVGILVAPEEKEG